MIPSRMKAPYSLGYGSAFWQMVMSFVLGDFASIEERGQHTYGLPTNSARRLGVFRARRRQ
jgi:hypothetical protein